MWLHPTGEVEWCSNMSLVVYRGLWFISRSLHFYGVLICHVRERVFLFFSLGSYNLYTTLPYHGILVSGLFYT